VLQSKSIEKKRGMTPLQNKSKRIISKQGVFRKTQKIFHTLAHFDQVAWLVSSWIRYLAQQHHVAQVNLILILPKTPHTSHRVGSWGSFKSLWWGQVPPERFERTIRGTLSLFVKISKLRDRMRKREGWVMQSPNRSTLQPPKARWKVTSPMGKTWLSFYRNDLFNCK
jgi:hypothetical protein